MNTKPFLPPKPADGAGTPTRCPDSPLREFPSTPPFDYAQDRLRERLDSLAERSRSQPCQSRGWLILAVLVAVWTQTAPAAEPKGGQDAALQQVLRKAQGVVRQLTQEKAALEAEKTALLGEKSSLEAKVKALEESVKKLEPLQGEVERYKASVESLQGTRTNLESQINQGREQNQTLLKKQRDIIAKAKEIQADNVLLVEAVKEREQWISQCGQHNQDLQGTNRELIEKYKDKSFWDELADLEPLTGIGKVQTENAAEEYRYRLQHLKTTPYQPQAPMPGQGGGEGAPAQNPLEEEGGSNEK